MPTAMESDPLLRRATYLAVTVALGLVALKAAAWAVTGSVGIAASLVDSMLDAVASGVNLWAVRVALKPADREHRFGHGKAEALAGLAQSAVVIGSAIFLVSEAISQLVNPRALAHGAVGVGVMVVSLVATVGLVAYQRMVIRKTRSLAIAADSLHYVGDILTNLAVIVGIVLAATLDWRWADPVTGLAVALVLIASAWRILQRAIDQLMDREAPDATREAILELIRAEPAVRGCHRLRTRESGRTLFVVVDLELDGSMSLQTAHDAGLRVARAITDRFPDAEVIVHHDPVD